MVENLGIDGFPVWITYLFWEGYNQADMRRRTKAVFILCLLKADVSSREATTGMQALHFLFWKPWSAELSSHVIDLAYILIRFGGADIHAHDYENRSPTIWALESGWENEWKIVLDRCGFLPNEVLNKEIEFLRKILSLGNGESTAIDTEDLSIPKSVLPRRRVVGARLDE